MFPAGRGGTSRHDKVCEHQGAYHLSLLDAFELGVRGHDKVHVGGQVELVISWLPAGSVTGPTLLYPCCCLGHTWARVPAQHSHGKQAGRCSNLA